MMDARARESNHGAVSRKGECKIVKSSNAVGHSHFRYWDEIIRKAKGDEMLEIGPDLDKTAEGDLILYVNAPPSPLHP